MITVAIPVYRRHDLLSNLLVSLHACPELHDGTAQCVLYPDHGEDSVTLSAQFPWVWVAPSASRRLYCDANTLRARRESFEDPTVTHVLTLDADMLVVPTFLTTLIRAEEVVSRHTPCILQSSITCTCNLAFKRTLVGHLATGSATGTMHLMRRSVWDAIKGDISDYLTLFPMSESFTRDNLGLWEWMASIAHGDNAWVEEHLRFYRNRSCGLAHDAMTYLSSLRHNILTVHTRANYAITVGDTGENMTPESFAALKNVVLDPLDAPDTFVWSPVQHPITLLPL